MGLLGDEDGVGTYVGRCVGRSTHIQIDWCDRAVGLNVGLWAVWVVSECERVVSGLLEVKTRKTRERDPHNPHSLVFLSDPLPCLGS